MKNKYTTLICLCLLVICGAVIVYCIICLKGSTQNMYDNTDALVDNYISTETELESTGDTILRENVPDYMEEIVEDPLYPTVFKLLNDVYGCSEPVDGYCEKFDDGSLQGYVSYSDNVSLDFYIDVLEREYTGFRITDSTSGISPCVTDRGIYVGDDTTPISVEDFINGNY